MTNKSLRWSFVSENSLVEPTGFEPVTSSMPSRRAPNCATAPPSYRECLTYNIPSREASNIVPALPFQALYHAETTPFAARSKVCS
jgi:hypothetical protein